MNQKETQPCCEKFKTVIGGQALIEGIMMRGPEKDAVVVRSNGELTVEVTPRKVRPKGSFATWPFIRGAVTFFDSQVVGVKALMRSVDLSPEDGEVQEEPSKFDKWLEEKLGNKKFQEVVVGFSVFLGLAMSIGLFFVLPSLIGMLFHFESILVTNLVEGLIRILIFFAYLILVSRMKEMKRVFAYHGAEHKTIRCYEAGLPLTVENVRKQTRLHPRCGTSFLLVVMVISILLFSVASSGLLAAIPALAQMQKTSEVLFKLIMIVFKLLLLPLVVSITYEINRWVGGHDNWFSRLLSAPGMWMQNFTTNEPDDDMIEVGIRAVEAVLPEVEGADRW